MTDDFTLKIRRFDPVDKRLGRNVVHDSRSWRFPFKAERGPRKLTSKRHLVGIPIMNQGNVGSCTGHAGANVLASGDFWAVGREVLQPDPHDYAVGLYSEATRLDPWPGEYTPDDTGSDGLSVAKALKARGLISGYSHAFSLQDALAAVATRVSMFGLSWWSSMFEPDSEGRLTISGQVEGGHEIAADEIDVQRERVWLRNQWGDSWGQGGRAFLVFDDLGRLLADDGDCTVLVPLAQPAPQPEPAPPPPPRPFPTQEDKNLAAALLKYLHNRNAAAYVRRAAEPWLKGR